MDKTSRWQTTLYWTAGLVFLVADLLRASASEYLPFIGGPFAMPEAVICLGLRAAADLFILAGLYQILSGFLLSQATTSSSHDAGPPSRPTTRTTIQPVNNASASAHTRPTAPVSSQNPGINDRAR